MSEQSRPFSESLTPYFEAVLKVVLQDAEENKRRAARAGVTPLESMTTKDLREPRPSPQ